MRTRFSHVLNPRGVVALGLLAAFIAVGCGGNISPFLSAQFAQTFLNLPDRNQGTPTTTPDNTTPDTAITSVCALDAANRNIQIALVNQAQQPVSFAITLAVSAGPGGFVCDAELPNYLNAGYVDALIPGQTVLVVGCDTVPLLSGTRILVRRYGINELGSPSLVAAAPGAETTRTLLTATGSPLIPLPELIIFGDADPNFICTGANLCTQRGFVYTNPSGIPVGKSAEVIRIQGTLCAQGFGTAPEWRLDKTPFNNAVQPFQYAAGGTIVATVLDRSGDAASNPRNQVVWLVTNENGDTIHIPDPG